MSSPAHSPQPRDVLEEAIEKLSALLKKPRSVGGRRAGLGGPHTVPARLTYAALVLLKEALKVAPRRQAATVGIELLAKEMLERADRFADEHPEKILRSGIPGLVAGKRSTTK
jgi:hypothetical protein